MLAEIHDLATNIGGNFRETNGVVNYEQGWRAGSVGVIFVRSILVLCNQSAKREDCSDLLAIQSVAETMSGDQCRVAARDFLLEDGSESFRKFEMWRRVPAQQRNLCL